MCVCASSFVSVFVHGRASASQFMRICDFQRYICSKVSISLAALDLVASNKLLFQCCLCSGLHHRQLCGLPPMPPQGEPYIRLVWVTNPLLKISDTGRQSGASSCHDSRELLVSKGYFWQFQSNSDSSKHLIVILISCFSLYWCPSVPSKICIILFIISSCTGP